MKSLGPEQTYELGRALNKKIKDFPVLILLDGPLGAGKTQFAQGFIQGFIQKSGGKKVPVTSPSYSLVNAYKKGKKSLYHVDLYRLNSADDLESIGFWDFFEGPNIILVEWAQKLPEVWPKSVKTIKVAIEILSENERSLEVIF